MLAAILLNLPDYQKPSRDADAAPLRNDRRKKAIETAQELESYLADKNVPTELKTLPERVKKHIEADRVSVDEVFNLANEVRLRTIELKEMASQRQATIDYLFMLDAFSVFLLELQDSEDDVIALLLMES